MPADTITIKDNRTDKTYELSIQDETIRALDLRKIKTGDDDFGLMTYDPGYTNTTSCKSRITFIDGDIGILNYRGYPIAQLAESSTYLETACLLRQGELPTAAALDAWTKSIVTQSAVPSFMENLIESFPIGSHPMGMFISALGALSTANPDSKHVYDAEVRTLHIHKLIAQVATIAAYAYRRQSGLPLVAPDPNLSFTGNFLRMMFGKTGERFRVNPVLERALEVLFILHADHEQNCSTSTMRMVGSSEADPYVSTAAAAAALYGPLHGGANEAVLKMLKEIGSKEHIPEYIRRVEAGEVKLMGFGHRVYKNYDPRARIIKQTAYSVFATMGTNPLLEMAIELERIALEDEYFVKRKLYPNVDFYSGMIYQAMGFPVEMFTVLFGLARTSGWLAQWEELLLDGDQKIGRPRQIYLGHGERAYVPLANR